MNLNIIIWNIFKVITFIKLSYYKSLWLNIKWFSGAWFFGFPTLRSARLIQIWKNFQIGKYSRLAGMIEIGDNVFINEFWSINAGLSESAKITIGNNVMFWPGCFLQSSDHAFRKWELYMFANEWRYWPIDIGDNCWIWARTIILKWVSIGANSVIWAGSVVTKSIPSWVVAVGNPARVLREIE